MNAAPVLSTHALSAGYGDFQALFAVDFEVRAGEVVALIGANGAGKSTLLRAILGLLPVAPDMVRFNGAPVGGSKPHVMVRDGIGIVPEGRRLFAGMSVADNLRVAIDYGRKPRRDDDVSAIWTIARIYDLFPILNERRNQLVHDLSGGQQQMVAIGRALLTQPKVLLCDEISLGLAPKVIHEIYQVVPTIRQAGTAIVLVEQDVSLAQRSSDRLYCMLEGRITLTGTSAGIGRDTITGAYFGAHHAVA